MAQARPEPTEATNVGRCTVRMTKKTNGGRRPRGGGIFRTIVQPSNQC
jgi:hypothetical protein